QKTHLILASLQPADSPDTLILTVDTTDRTLSDQIHSAWRHMVGIDYPLQPFYQFIQSADPILAPVIERLSGYQVLRDYSPYESLITSIISQQLNLSFAAQLKHTLLELTSEPLTVGEHRLFAFPLPSEIAALDISELRSRKFSQRKAEYLVESANAIASGQLDLLNLTTLPNELVISRLSDLRGVGRWTAECVLLFGMGRPDLLPAADIGLRNAIRLIYELDHQPTEEEVRELGAGWHPWESYVTYYLWAALDAQRKGALNLPHRMSKP
ncbi:MAG: hypothetical protein JWN30_640, partial [Bacilli bacterium]|nr:hypothetical protein [Bacilli bacterium]